MTTAQPSRRAVQQWPGNAATRFVVLDGWRGTCALLVALHHFATTGTISNTPFIQNASLFVDFFFVLSGFVIAHSYGGRIGSSAEARAFLFKRIGRVWPLHVTMLIVLIGLEAGRGAMGAGSSRVSFTTPDAAAAILPNLLLLQSFGFVNGLSWNVPSWSISVEFGAYLMFAASTLLFRRTPVAFGCVIIAVAFATLAASPGQLVDDTQVLGLFRGFLGFFIGVLTYRARLQAARRLLSVGPALNTWFEIAAILVIIVFISVADGGMLPLIAPFLFGLTVFVFSYEGGLVSQALLSGPARTLGRLSYSIYMVHYVILLMLGAALTAVDHRFGLHIVGDVSENPLALKVFDFGSAWRSDVASLLFLVVAVAVASVTYELVEMPGQRMFRRMLESRRPAPPVSGEA